MNTFQHLRRGEATWNKARTNGVDSNVFTLQPSIFAHAPRKSNASKLGCSVLGLRGTTIKPCCGRGDDDLAARIRFIGSEVVKRYIRSVHGSHQVDFDCLEIGFGNAIRRDIEILSVIDPSIGSN